MMEGTPRKVYEHKPRYLLAPSKNIQPSTTLLGQLNPLSPALFSMAAGNKMLQH